MTEVRDPSEAYTAPATDSFLTQVHPPETIAQDFNPDTRAGVVEYIEWSSHSLPSDDLGQVFKHSGWAANRKRVYEALIRTEQTLARRLDFAECGKHAYVLRSVEDPNLYVLGGSACKDRFCLPCAQARARIIAVNVQDHIGKKQARFLTLTLKSTTESLADLLQKLTRDFASLRRSKLWRSKVTGGVAFLEVKWFEATQRWHPHLHCLLQGRYLPKEDLSKLWQKITGTSFIIDIRIAEDNHHVTGYIVKYATKALDNAVVREPERLDEALEAMKGKRLCMTFGSWRGVCLTEKPESGTWIQLGTLFEVKQHAEAGWPSAMAALDALEIAFDRPARPPPKTQTDKRRDGPDPQMRLETLTQRPCCGDFPLAS